MQQLLTALSEFQTNQGLPQNGVCDCSAWDALIEASWLSGTRLMYLTFPHPRDDDVVALQINLALLGLDCGHTGGLVADDICGAEKLHHAARIGDSLKIVVDCFGDLQHVSRGLTRTLREHYNDVMTVKESDKTLRATQALYVQRSLAGLPPKSPSEQPFQGLSTDLCTVCEDCQVVVYTHAPQERQGFVQADYFF